MKSITGTDCLAVLEQPLEKIRQDIFFRADNFQGQPWYDDLLIYKTIGVCSPSPAHTMTVQKALKVLGYTTHTVRRNNKTYICPGEERQTDRNSQSKKRHSRER